MTPIPDRIEKKILLRASKARVWRALSDSKEFGAWFGVNIEGPFAPGKAVSGRITTKGYEHLTMVVIVEKVDRERLLSFRWHPYAIDPKVDYSKEPTTLVEFRLEDGQEGTLLTVVESGFDAIPIARRAEAYKSNEGGWVEQMQNMERYVEEG